MMITNPIQDDRIHQIRDIVEALVGKAIQTFSNVMSIMVDGSWILVIEVDSTLIYEVPFKNLISDQIFSPIAFRYDTIKDEENRDIYYGTDNQLLYEMQNRFFMYRNLSMAVPPAAIDNDLRMNPEFEKLVNIKTDKGLKYFKLNSVDSTEVFMIPMFSGFISLSKPDTIGIAVYKIDDVYLELKMNIFKKKINRNISVYCRIIRI